MKTRSFFSIQRAERKYLVFLTIIPAITFSWSFILRVINGPFYANFCADPEYMYLLNGLNILNFIPPDHIDHPGTTLQVLSALVIFVKWLVHYLFDPAENLQLSVLKHPEEYLGVINIAINFLLSTVILFAGVVTFRCYRLLLPSFVMQLSPLLYLQFHIAITRVSPEPLLIFTTLLLVSLLLPGIVDDDSTQCRISDTKRSILAGVVIGFGIATKVTFAPLFGVVFLFQGLKRKISFILASCLSFILFTLPIISHYPKMFNWLYSIASHQGAYGAGESGLPHISILYKTLTSLCIDEPFFFIQAAIYLVILLLFTLKKQICTFKQTRLRLLLATGLVIILVQILLAAKSPGGLSAGSRYLLPAIVFTALINTSLAHYICYNKHETLKAIKYIFIATMTLGTLTVIYKLGSWIIKTELDQTNIKRVELLAANKEIISIPYYGAPGIDYALSLGNDFAGFRYSNDLKKIYPSRIFYEVFKKEFYSYGDFISRLYIRSYLMRGNTVILYGIPLGDKESNMTLETVFTTNTIGAYKIMEFND